MKISQQKICWCAAEVQWKFVKSQHACCETAQVTVYSSSDLTDSNDLRKQFYKAMQNEINH